jgi:hypothetical protein
MGRSGDDSRSVSSERGRGVEKLAGRVNNDFVFDGLDVKAGGAVEAEDGIATGSDEEVEAFFTTVGSRGESPNSLRKVLTSNAR